MIIILGYIKNYKNYLTNIIINCKKDFYTKSLDNRKSINTYGQL